MGAPVGNQNAAKSRAVADGLRKAAIQEDWTRFNAGIKKIWDAFADGQPWAVNFVRDQLDGPLQTRARIDIEHSGAIEHIGLPEIGGRVADLLADRASSDSSALLPH